MSEESSTPESATPQGQPTTPPVQQPTAPAPVAYTKEQKDKKIIIHNASFDLGFLNGELGSIKKNKIRISVSSNIEISLPL